MEQVTHPIAPVYDKQSKILILGSFPSVKSRETAFFYGHPQNRFWRVVSGVLGVPCPKMVEEKRSMLLANRIALWDVIASCCIEGSSDSSIRDVAVCGGLGSFFGSGFGFFCGGCFSRCGFGCGRFAGSILRGSCGFGLGGTRGAGNEHHAGQQQSDDLFHGLFLLFGLAY